MTAATTTNDGKDRGKPPLAVVGSQISYDEEMFGAAFDGIVVRRFWEFVRPYRRMLWIGIVGVLFFTLTQVAIPLLIRHAIDDALLGGAEGVALLHQIIIAFFAVLALNYAANVVQEMIVGRIAGHLLFDLRRAMYKHLQYVSLSFMDKTEAGRLMSRLQGDVNALQEFLETSIFAVGDIVLLIGIVACVVLLIAITPRLRALSRAARQASATLFTRVQETFQSIQAIKAYGFETPNYDRFQSESTQAIDTAFSLRREFAMVKVCTAYILVLVLFVTDYIATRYVLEGDVVFGVSLLVLFGLSVTAWTVAAHQARRGSVEAFKSTFEDLIRVWCLAQDMAVGLGRAFWLLDLEPEVTDAENPEPFPDVHQGVSFHNVTFGYRPKSPVLQEVNLTARVGEVIALVGPSGSGKSTLVSMLLRLFDPDSGYIKIDETDIRSVKIEALRKNVAIALQENTLFPVSIEDNLRYAAPDVSDSQLHSSVKIACAEFIEELPQGYRTELGVGGALLSTGQKQRLSIARALVRNTPILILDEPTASLDAQTERRVLSNLRIWAKEKIVFIVTHRPSTIRDADRVVFLKNGRITETGTHEELLSQGGDYQRFASIEASDD